VRQETASAAVCQTPTPAGLDEEDVMTR